MYFFLAKQKLTIGVATRECQNFSENLISSSEEFFRTILKTFDFGLYHTIVQHLFINIDEIAVYSELKESSAMLYVNSNADCNCCLVSNIKLMRVYLPVTSNEEKHPFFFIFRERINEYNMLAKKMI